MATHLKLQLISIGLAAHHASLATPKPHHPLTSITHEGAICPWFGVHFYQKILRQRTGNTFRATEKTRHVQVKENKDHQILDTLDAEARHKMVLSYQLSWLIVAPRPKALNEFRNLLSASVAVSGIMHFLALSWCGHGEGPMAAWRQYEGIKPMGGPGHFQTLSSSSGTSGIDMSTCGFSTCLIAPCLKFDFLQLCAVHGLYQPLQCFEDTLGITWYDLVRFQQETVLWLWWFLCHSPVGVRKIMSACCHCEVQFSCNFVPQPLGQWEATIPWNARSILFIFCPQVRGRGVKLAKTSMSGYTYTYSDCFYCFYSMYVGKARHKCRQLQSCPFGFIQRQTRSGIWWKRLERIQTTLANTKAVCPSWLAKPLPKQIAGNIEIATTVIYGWS